MTFDAFSKNVDDFSSLNGVDEGIAAAVLSYLGDTPETDPNGNALAPDGGGQLKTWKLPTE
jgi:hypothetical protein